MIHNILYQNSRIQYFHTDICCTLSSTQDFSSPDLPGNKLHHHANPVQEEFNRNAADHLHSLFINLQLSLASPVGQIDLIRVGNSDQAAIKPSLVYTRSEKDLVAVLSGSEPPKCVKTPSETRRKTCRRKATRR